MTRGPFELTTAISSLADLRASDLGPYDAVYLGNLYCARYEGNLLERPGELGEAVLAVRDQGRRAYVTTYAAPHGRDLDRLRRALAAARAAGALAAEVHGPGLARLVRTEFPELQLHLGSFANVYTGAGAAVYRALGAARIAPPAELPLDEVAGVARAGGVPVEVTVHGKLPLGVSDSCLLLGCEPELGVGCPDLCRQDVFLSRDDWTLKSVGTGVLSGRDACLLEHLPRLLADGHRHFRIEAVSETPAYRVSVGRVYREALAQALAGDAGLDPEWWALLRAHSRAGLCNGFAFGRSGLEYVGGGRARTAEAAAAGSTS
ncbi:MAG TPA: peptidase U32 family protein [Methylomirabilota bacterium]